jgi:hypothetical protein
MPLAALQHFGPKQTKMVQKSSGFGAEIAKLLRQSTQRDGVSRTLAALVPTKWMVPMSRPIRPKHEGKHVFILFNAPFART